MPTREEQLDALLSSLTTAAVNTGRKWRDPAVRGALRQEIERVTAWRREDAARQHREEVESRFIPVYAFRPFEKPAEAPDQRHVRLPYKDD